ncbi:MAG: RNA 2',3'-cyclic phosphodiesterase [Anaerolineales bacterium]
MKQVIRAFIAIEIPHSTQAKLAALIQTLQRSIPTPAIRWVKSENIHLTLKFLGDVSVGNISLLEDILNKEVEKFKPFEMSVGELGAFPNPKRARVIWVDVAAPNELMLLQRAIDIQTVRLGYNAEERSFSPHLTLGRVNRNATMDHLNIIAQVLQKNPIGFIDVVPVTSVNLYQSELNPGGSIYTCLYSAKLAINPS